MRVAVLGSTGETGREVVTALLDAGHIVTALVRDPTRLPVTHASLTTTLADVFRYGAWGVNLNGVAGVTVRRAWRLGWRARRRSSLRWASPRLDSGWTGSPAQSGLC